MNHTDITGVLSAYSNGELVVSLLFSHGVKEPMHSGEVGDYCDGAQGPNRLAQKEPNNENPIPPAPVTRRWL